MYITLLFFFVILPLTFYSYKQEKTCSKKAFSKEKEREERGRGGEGEEGKRRRRRRGRRGGVGEVAAISGEPFEC